MAKILIVDDDLYIRELYEEVLKGEGNEVETAVDGNEALEKLSKNTYDLVLLDVMMPKLDGLEVLGQIKEKAMQHGPIVLLTNLSHGPVIDEGKEKGAAGFLIKADLTPDQLVAKVKEFLTPSS
jgi:CheY-like chemotaxis protein